MPPADLPAPLFPPHHSRESGRPDGPLFRELHLYHGSLCDRECDFCTVDGSPTGWSEPMTERTASAIRRLLAQDGNLKIYGGEPALEVRSLVPAIARLRRDGFTGWITYFSNGVRARSLLRLLQSDPRSEAVLNWSILHGQGAPAIPRASLNILLRWARGHGGRIFSGHSDLVPVGRGAGAQSLENRKSFGAHCPGCRPVLTTRGLLHACPFAVESTNRRYHLAQPGEETTAAEAISRHQAFLREVHEVIEPRAAELSVHPCAVCTIHAPLVTLKGLPDEVVKPGRSEEAVRLEGSPGPTSTAGAARQPDDA